jgi:quercetin dioxygenase-like cupin family protein
MTTMTTDPLFITAEQTRWEDVGGGIRRQILCHLPELMMVKVAFEAGGVGAPHSHPHVQCSVVESGTFDVTIGGETRRLHAGCSFIVPPNVEHGVVAIEAGVLVDAFTPRRDDFLGSR